MDTFGIKLFIVALLSFNLSATEKNAALKTIYIEDDCSEKRNVSSPIIYHVGSTNSSNSSGILAISRNDSYDPYFDCWIILRPPSDGGIILTIHHVKNPEPNTFGGNITTENSVDVSLPCGCINSDQNESKSYDSHGDLNIHFYNGSDSCIENRKDFMFIYTAYSRNPCESFEFECPSGCISKTLICDGYNHCGDNSDQKNCGRNKTKETWRDAVKGLSYAASFGVCFGSIAFIIIHCVIKLKELCIKYCCRQCRDSPCFTESQDITLSRVTFNDRQYSVSSDSHLSRTESNESQSSRTSSNVSESSTTVSYDSQNSSDNSVGSDSGNADPPPSYEPPPSYDTLQHNDSSG